jgi:hypothetical protein
MSFSVDTFVGVLGQATYDFTIEFLSSAHLSVTVDGAAVAFTVNSTRTQFTITGTSIVGGESIVVTRATPATDAGRLVDFTDLSHVRQRDLDTSSLQLLYIAQETIDFIEAATCMALGGSGHWAGLAHRIQNLSAGVAGTDAVTKAQLDAISVAAGDLPVVSSADNDKSLWVVAGAWAIRTPSQARTHLGLGTAAILNAGTGANQVIQLDGSARYPANDGRNIDLVNNVTLGLRYRTTVSQLRNSSEQTPVNDATATWSEGAGSRLALGAQTSLDNSSDVVLSGTKITLSAGTWELQWLLRAFNQNAAAGNDQDLRVKLTDAVDGPTQVVYDTEYDRVDIEAGGAVRVFFTLGNTLLLKLAAGGDVVIRATNEDGVDIRIASLVLTARKVSTSTA